MLRLDGENLTDLLLGSLRSGSCEAQNSRRRTELFLDHFVQHKVRRSEVMRPLRGAVNFINANHRDFPSKLCQVLEEKSFGRDKQNFDELLLNSSNYLLLLLVGLLRVDCCTWNEVGQLSELVGH